MLLDGAPVTEPHTQGGVVFQHANLMPWRTARANVMLPLEVQGAPRDAGAQEMLALVGLEGFEESLPRELSGGMRQRVALARALVHDPDLCSSTSPLGRWTPSPASG